jgi:hypothetical protein
MNMSEADWPTRSENGMAALDIFYSDFNDVNFYVEDEDQQNLYQEIFKKLFKRIRITRIFPLGGKPAVLQHARSGANQGIKCFRAYVVDRDFDHLLGKQVEHPNVFYLDRFCIESHVLEAPSIVELVIENHPKSNRANVQAKLSLDTQIPFSFKSLRPLFTLFLCTQYLDLRVLNCSLPPEAFCEPKRPWDLKATAITNYRSVLIAAAEANGLAADMFESQCAPVSSLAIEAPDYELVSGKFVTAMIFHYVKSKYSLGSMTFDSFVYRLAKNCKLQSMSGFAARVKAAVTTHSAIDSNVSA